ncbi:MAG: DUF115 domain-containing protein [Desulfurococcus sp.]|nr:DUF115 domain-containing protein [Desulfurococcus sp.]
MSWIIPRREWEPLYQYIRSVVKLSFDRDQEAADLLSSILSGLPNTIEFDDLKRLQGGFKRAVVFGCGGNLLRDIETARELSLLEDSLLVASDGSTSILLLNSLTPSIVVTDLDGLAVDLWRASSTGSVTVIHAHGDNIPRIKEYTKGFKGPLIGSTQVEPRPHVYNFGGFTDGDRGVFVAVALGVREVYLAGFDLHGEPTPCPGKTASFNRELKRAKLKIASRMLEYISSRKNVTIRRVGDVYE